MQHVRLYQSALRDVRYVYKKPVPFDKNPEVINSREAAKSKVVANQH